MDRLNIYDYPTPLCQAYTKMEGIDEYNVQSKHISLRELFEVWIKYVTIIFISKYINDRNKGLGAMEGG